MEKRSEKENDFIGLTKRSNPSEKLKSLCCSLFPPVCKSKNKQATKGVTFSGDKEYSPEIMIICVHL